MLYSDEAREIQLICVDGFSASIIKSSSNGMDWPSCAMLVGCKFNAEWTNVKPHHLIAGSIGEIFRPCAIVSN